MVEGKVTITNKSGFHARPASLFVNYAKEFKDSNIFIQKGEKTVDAKSILHLLSFGLNTGAEITVRVEGGEEDEVLRKVTDYISKLED